MFGSKYVTGAEINSGDLYLLLWWPETPVSEISSSCKNCLLMDTFVFLVVCEIRTEY